MVEHVDHVSLRPDYAVAAVFVEESVVSVFAFRDVPFVEILEHHHEAHLVAEFDELLGRHVVGCADGVASHVLEHCELSAESGLVDGCSKRTEVMVQADSAELARLAVEEESLVRDDLYGSESESCADLVAWNRAVCY